MRQKTKTYTLSAAAAAGFIASTSGAGPFTTIAGAPADGIGHKATITSTANLSGLTFTISGRSPEGTAINEALTGPNNATVTGTKYFASVTGVTVSATTGASTFTVGWAAACATPAIPLSPYMAGAPLIGAYLDNTTVTYSVQQTNINIFDEPVHDDWTDLAASGSVNTLTQAKIGITAIRALVSAHTNGVLELTITAPRR